MLISYSLFSVILYVTELLVTMAEEKLHDLLTRMVNKNEEQDARIEALLQAIKNPPAPAAKDIRA